MLNRIYFVCPPFRLYINGVIDLNVSKAKQKNITRETERMEGRGLGRWIHFLIENGLCCHSGGAALSPVTTQKKLSITRKFAGKMKASEKSQVH